MLNLNDLTGFHTWVAHRYQELINSGWKPQEAYWQAKRDYWEPVDPEPHEIEE